MKDRLEDTLPMDEVARKLNEELQLENMRTESEEESFEEDLDDYEERPKSPKKNKNKNKKKFIGFGRGDRDKSQEDDLDRGSDDEYDYYDDDDEYEYYRKPKRRRRFRPFRALADLFAFVSNGIKLFFLLIKLSILVFLLYCGYSYYTTKTIPFVTDYINEKKLKTEEYIKEKVAETIEVPKEFFKIKSVKKVDGGLEVIYVYQGKESKIRLAK
ncbi:hypothetical protein [Peptoniphilus duerdenii]|uniref:hypothetical protein n=1 Tax=Peptoniphilus duerdenii TaxID=507750 RepID=UPI0023F3DD0B|nr:hypothetical protein [Peptoniphilus duerdenii]